MSRRNSAEWDILVHGASFGHRGNADHVPGAGDGVTQGGRQRAGLTLHPKEPRQGGGGKNAESAHHQIPALQQRQHGLSGVEIGLAALIQDGLYGGTAQPNLDDVEMVGRKIAQARPERLGH